MVLCRYSAITTAFSTGVVLFVAVLRELNRGCICTPFFYLQLKQKEFELSTVRGEVDESSQHLREQVKFFCRDDSPCSMKDKTRNAISYFKL